MRFKDQRAIRRRRKNQGQNYNRLFLKGRPGNEGEGKLVPCRTKDNIILTHPSCSSTINFISISIFPPPHRPHIDPTSTPHWPYVDLISTPHRPYIHSTSLRLSDFKSQASLSLLLRHHELTNNNVSYFLINQ